MTVPARPLVTVYCGRGLCWCQGGKGFGVGRLDVEVLLWEWVMDESRCFCRGGVVCSQDPG